MLYCEHNLQYNIVISVKQIMQNIHNSICAFSLTRGKQAECIGRFGAWLCMVLKLGRLGQQIRNIWKVLKCGAGEGWRRSVGPII